MGTAPGGWPTKRDSVTGFQQPPHGESVVLANVKARATKSEHTGREVLGEDVNKL